MVNRDDVARRAGVSTAVVSYVINGGPRPVAEGTRRRVEDAIRELGYRPNGLARALRTQRSAVLGLVVPDSSNPYFAEIARVVESVAYHRGMTLLLGNSAQQDERESAYVGTFLDGRVEGLLLISSGHSPKVMSMIREASTPVVFVDRAPADTTYDAVEVDNYGGGRTAMQHLLDHGHTQLAAIVGDSPQADDRLRGAQREIEEHGSARLEIARHIAFDRMAGYEAGTVLLSTEHRPTAIFATADQQAIGLLRAAADLGLSVPDDVAVVSFDGTPEAAFTRPGLTTIGQPFEAIARAAVERLLVLIATKDSRVERVALPVEITRRGSCGCPDALITNSPPHDAVAALDDLGPFDGSRVHLPPGTTPDEGRDTPSA